MEIFRQEPSGPAEIAIQVSFRIWKPNSRWMSNFGLCGSKIRLMFGFFIRIKHQVSGGFGFISFHSEKGMVDVFMNAKDLQCNLHSPLF